MSDQTFVIDRETWLHPEARKAAGIESVLFDSATGLMCCIGQVGVQVNVAQCALDNKTMPGSLERFNQDRFPSGLLFSNHNGSYLRNSLIATRIASINDGFLPSDGNGEGQGAPDGLSLADREVALQAEFAAIDIQLSFTGDPQVAVQKGLDYAASVR